MAKSAKLSLNSIFLFLFLILFPFGQIIRIGIIQPVDVVAGLAAVFSVIRRLPKPEVFKYLSEFLLFALVSWLFSLTLFPQIGVFYGLLYLLRLGAYIYFLIYIWNFAKEESSRKLLLNCLLGVAVAAAIFGWAQFFWFSDLRPFFPLGWDEHLYRLFGTFLDPTFLGLIIVFGLIITTYQYIVIKQNKYLLLAVFLLITLAFTYSRASYLALFAGLSVIAYYKKVIGKLLVVSFGLLLLILVLPTSKNHVLSFTRQFSAVARVENYKTTLNIFEKSPVFGVGYDNMCIAYQKFIGPQGFSSHACSGSDSSLLFILATTGVAGLMVFIFMVIWIARYVKNSRYVVILGSSFAALAVHSLFSNSLFYPWILGWIMILLAISL